MDIHKFVEKYLHHPIFFNIDGVEYAGTIEGTAGSVALEEYTKYITVNSDGFVYPILIHTKNINLDKTYDEFYNDLFLLIFSKNDKESY